MKFFLFSIFFFSLAHGLEVDEKLTLRILKVSESRKTIFINRGEEDGLKKGDHAKFFTTAGVVARGMVIKASPQRTIWAVYRLISADNIVNDSVMNLKITKPVKVTYDNTKMLIEDDTPRSTTDGSGANVDDIEALGIPLAQGADDNVTGLTTTERAELAELRSKILAKDIGVKRYEVWGALQMGIMNQNIKTQVSNQDVDVSKKKLTNDVTLGGEYYFKEVNEWYYNFSLVGFLHMVNNSYVNFQGDQEDVSIFEYGGGANWYFMGEHSKAETFIPYGSALFGIGSLSNSYTENASNSQITELSGKTGTYAFGLGLKYYSFRGYGMRMLADYFSRTETYAGGDGVVTSDLNKTTSGLRLQLGISYRF